jgi:hypothetical protein
MAGDSDQLSQQPLAVVSEGPPVMGAALVADWLGTATVQRRDGTDDHGHPVYTASFEMAPTEARPDQPSVKGDLRLVLDAQSDPARVEVDGITDGARFRMQMALSDIGGDISIPTPGDQELGVTGPVTRDDAIAAGISNPVQLGRVPKGWVLMRMTVETSQPRPGCATLQLEYRNVDGDQSAQTDISPEEFADADSLSELEVETPVDAIARLSEAFGECDLAGSMAAVIAERIMEEADWELPTEVTACIEDKLSGAAVATAALFVDGSPGDLQTAIGEALVACPEVLTEILLSQLPAEPTPEIEACVLDFVRANPDLTVAFFEQDEATTQEIGTELAGACPAAIGSG